MYTVSSYADSTPYDPFAGYRHFWSVSYGGAYVTDYDAGYVLGEADLENGNTANLDALTVIGVNDRDMAWNAKVDGYTYATRARGPNELRR